VEVTAQKFENFFFKQILDFQCSGYGCAGSLCFLAFRIRDQVL